MQQIILWPLLAGTLYMDLKESRIPNALTVPAALAGLASHLILDGWQGLSFGLQGMVIGFLLLLIPFFTGGIGGGDVKFLAALGAVAGPAFVLSTCLYGAIIGGVISLFLMIKEKRLVHLAVGMVSRNVTFSNRYFPYGIALVAGAVITFVTRLAV